MFDSKEYYLRNKEVMRERQRRVRAKYVEFRNLPFFMRTHDEWLRIVGSKGRVVLDVES